MPDDSKPSSAEKQRGTVWLVAAIITAKIAQMVLKHAHHEASAGAWVIGIALLGIMFFCMMRSWQYLYLGRKVPPPEPPMTQQKTSHEKQFEKK